MQNEKIHIKKELILKIIYSLAAVAIFLIISFAGFYSLSILKQENHSAEEYLQQAVLQTASNIRNCSKNDINDLKNLSNEFSSTYSSFSDNEISQFLKQKLPLNKYYKFSYIYPDGKTLQYSEKDGLKTFPNNDESFCVNNALSGNPCFSGTVEEPDSFSGFTDCYYMPVFDANKNILGVLKAEIDSDVFKKILSLNNYDNKGFSHVIDSDGNYIIKSKNDLNNATNFFDTKIRFLGTTKEKIQEDLKTKNNGIFRFKSNDGVKYVSAFAFIGNNNAFVLTDVPQNVLMMNTNSIIGIFSIVLLAVGAIFLFLLKLTISLYKRNEKKLYQVAFVDEITETGNKNQFVLSANELLSKYKNKNFAIISAEINDFSTISHLCGKIKANKIIKDIFSVLNDNLPQNSVCARDFASSFIILYQYDNEQDIVDNFINQVSEEIKKYNDETETIYEEDSDTKIAVDIKVSFGIYLINDLSLSVLQMCDNAILAKQNIKNIENYKFFDENTEAQIIQNKSVEEEMLSALGNKQFKMYLQPKYDLHTKEIIGAEALVRWHHPTRGIIPPMDFIPVFEQNGFIINLDNYIWRQACDFLSLRKRTGKKMFPISVNISKMHFYNENFIDELLNLTKSFDIVPCFIETEFTEKAYLNNEQKCINIINRLKENGFITSLDDFGIGYSSVEMLRHLPIDVLKIDRLFVGESCSDEKNKIMLKAILDIAKQLNIKTVAEGVETEEQFDFLKNSGCDYAQGFLFSRPLDDKNFIQMFLS